jgi:hypothetical protein
LSWTTPRTWTIAEFVTKAILDTHVRDNLNALKPAYVQAYLSAAQNHTSTGNYQTINWDAENFDSDGFHDNVTNNSRLTVPTGLGGFYMIFATIQYSSFAATPATTGVKFQKNGADIFSTRGGTGPIPNGCSLMIPFTLAAGDYVTAMGWQNSTGTAAYSTGGGGESCQFGMFKVFSP